jgi:acyl-homoserine lactone synthase
MQGNQSHWGRRALDFVDAIEAWWLPRFERIGWKAHTLGLRHQMDGISALAVLLVDCDEATWKSLCGQVGMSGPTLTWRGCSDLSRRAQPALSALPPPAARQAR